MPRLPDVAAEAQQPAPQPASGVASYDPTAWRQVGMAGQVIQGAGREMEEATNTIAATNDRQDALVAQAGGNSLSQQRVALEFDPNSGFRNAKLGQAVGQPFIDGYTQKYDDAVQKIRDSLLNDNQRRLLDQHSAVQSLQYKSALLQHQAVETERFNEATDDATLKNALAAMAQKPLDELGFQTGIAQIDGTIDSAAKRKGIPPEQVSNLKSTLTDAAYTTRITSIMDGIPGVAPANPYLAEKMFRQVQDRLGPVSQTRLAAQVQKSLQNVQAREVAQAAVFGGAFPAVPSLIRQTISGPPLHAVVQQLESGGDTSAISPKGAAGAMQVMPGTAADPGYGVRPAHVDADGKPLPGELERVGNDYLGAMSARYGDPALVMAAYNAGPGMVDQWLVKNGDPRSGQISMQDWVDKIPVDETRSYVSRGMRMLGDTGHPTAPVRAPSAHELKTDLYARAFAARKLAEQQYPGDEAYADSVMTRVLNYGNMVIANQDAAQSAASDALRQGMIGTKPDGSDAPQTIDMLLADPAMKRSWDNATPQVRAMVQREYATGVAQHSRPELVNELTRRIYLPDGDPQKLTQPWQINEYMGNGLVHTDRQRLIKEMKDALDPEGSPFVKQVGNVKAAGRRMLTGAMNAMAITHPELAEEAAYRFAQDLDQKIASARKAGTDPQTLFTPGSKDYALDPSRVASFMPSEQDIAARAARARTTQPVAPVGPTATDPTTGRRVILKDGQWQPL